jgi:hypothetical protein
MNDISIIDANEGRSVDDGFDRGDDNKLQLAMLANLEKEYAEAVVQGDDEQAVDIKADIDALKAIMARDATNDPTDSTPDDLTVM